jgi:hypothetical protein
MCMTCGGKAIRTYEGMEDDHYLCESCGAGFGIDWSRGAPSHPLWPPTPEDLEMMKQIIAARQRGP